MDFQYIQVCKYTMVYDLLHNNLPHIHIHQGMDQYIYFDCRLRPRDNPNQSSIQVYNPDMGHQNNQASRYTIQRFLLLYTQHLRHKATDHMGLSIQPSMELQYYFKNDNVTYR